MLLERNFRGQGVKEKLSFVLGISISELGLAIEFIFVMFPHVLFHFFENGKLVREIKILNFVLNFSFTFSFFFGRFFFSLRFRSYFFREFINFLDLDFVR